MYEKTAFYEDLKRLERLFTDRSRSWNQMANDERRLSHHALSQQASLFYQGESSTRWRRVALGWRVRGQRGRRDRAKRERGAKTKPTDRATYGRSEAKERVRERKGEWRGGKIISGSRVYFSPRH